MTPPSYDVCDGTDYMSFTGGGTCATDHCELASDSTNCPLGCTVNTSGDGECLATSTACGDAISTMYTAMGATDQWTWTNNSEGWDLDGYAVSEWTRTTSRGHDSGDDESAALRYYWDNWSERTQFVNGQDLSACSSCSVFVDYYVDGNVESCSNCSCDFVRLDCSGNGGSSWTSGTPVCGSKSWQLQTQAINSSCLTNNFKLSLLFESDSSVTRAGYYVDDVELYVGGGAGYGNFDSVNASAASGWACHASDYNDALEIHVYFYKNGAGTPVERVITAGNTREQAVGDICGGDRDHGWTLNIDPDLTSWLGSGSHTVHAYAAPPGACGGSYYELSASPKTLTL
jgi:hypothetical protein